MNRTIEKLKTLPNKIARDYRERAAKYPYSFGRVAALSRALAEHRDERRRSAVLPQWAQDAYCLADDMTNWEYVEEGPHNSARQLRVNLPGGAQLVVTVGADDINPISDSYSTRTTTDRYGNVEARSHGADDGHVSRDIDTKPAMLYCDGGRSWRWVKDIFGGTIRDEAGYYKAHGASRSVALQLARDATVSRLNYVCEVLESGCQSYFYSVELAGIEDDGHASCGGFDDETYCHRDSRAPQLYALEEYVKALAARTDAARAAIKAAQDEAAAVRKAMRQARAAVGAADWVPTICAPLRAHLKTLRERVAASKRELQLCREVAA